MKNCLVMIYLFIKQQLSGKVFPFCAAIFLLLFSAFALLCPENRPISARVGISYDLSDTDLNDAFSPLFDSDDIPFVYYFPNELDKMRRDILLGELHCGYVVSNNFSAPITVFETDGSFLTPATDEIIFSAWFTARMEDIFINLSPNSEQAALISKATEHQHIDKPLTITINTVGPSSEKSEYSMLSPLIYAVSISFGICCAIFCGIFSPKSGKNAVSFLYFNAGKNKILFCMGAAQSALYFSLFMLCELILFALGVSIAYPLTARICAYAITAVICAVAAMLFYTVNPRPPVLFGIMFWSAGSVLLSGTIISPELLGSAQWLKFLSPAWFIIKFMTNFT